MTGTTDLTEQLLLRQTARELFASDPTPSDIASLGWPGLLTSVEQGGEGWFPFEAALIALEGGRAGTASTWFMSAVAAALASHSHEARGWVGALLSGEITGSFAPAPDLRRTAGTFSGTVSRLLSERPPGVVVLAGPPTIGTVAISTEGGGLRLVEGPGTLETERTLFRLVVDERLGHVVAQPEATTLGHTARVLLCADTVGAVRRAVQTVSDHLSARIAFEVPIASFQIIQHRLVDLATFESASEALVLRAASALAGGEPKAQRLALAAHAYIERRAVQAIDDCIQLAGGVGFTWEFALHHALRRASTNAALLGSGRSSRYQLAVLERRAQ